MKIVIFDTESWEEDVFKELEKTHQVIKTHHQLNKKNIKEFKDADIISTFIYSELNEDLLSNFENLKFIATRSTGYDYINISYCRENGIAVSNVPTYSENTVAEYVFALLLTISRRMVESIERTKKGNFSFEGLQGFDLKDKTIGVIGTGNIGKNVIQIANGFRMNVIAFDVKPDKELEKKIGFKYVSLNDLLSESDIITLHVPANEKTRHMISEKELNKMKQKAVLINTSRGSIVDIEALIKTLGSNKLKAIGLDVLPDEPVIREEAEILRSIYKDKHDLENLLADEVLMKLSNVYITPHNAFNTKESLGRILDTTLDNIISFIEGKPKNLVTD